MAKKVEADDDFRVINGYGWDYVIVFKVFSEDEELTERQIKFNMKYVLSHLTDAGLDFYLFYSKQVCSNYNILFRTNFH